MARAVRPRSPRLNPLRPFARCIVGVERRPRPGGGKLTLSLTSSAGELELWVTVNWSEPYVENGPLRHRLHLTVLQPLALRSLKSTILPHRPASAWRLSWTRLLSVSCSYRQGMTMHTSTARSKTVVVRTNGSGTGSQLSAVTASRRGWALPSKAAQQIRVVIGPWANGGLAPESSPAWLADQRSQSVGRGGQKDPV